METDFLKDLNAQQQEAVKQTDGPMIILAGAGSGKTRVLTYKVLYLIRVKGVAPDNILMVTFTNKAANEMKERVQESLSQLSTLGSQPTIATFHALCAKILRIEGKYIGLTSRFIIYDTQDSIDLIKLAMEKLGLSPKEFKPSSMLTTISQAKNQLISAGDYISFARGHFQETVARVYPLYQKLLQENDAVDFDDLMLSVIALFQKNPTILEKYQNKFRYILIDEYQDTNHAQYLLSKLLAKKYQNVCVVGDFSQSIYSWRGANFQNLVTFEQDFKNTKTFSLEQNYRSTQKILDSAYAVISKNTSHPVLKLWTNQSGGDNITIYEARNEQDEAEFILRNITSTNDLRNIAVLYRTNAQSRVLEEVFLHHGVPYVLVGGTRFYERKEVKDVLSYLRILSNPRDSVSEKRIQKLGKGRYAKFLDFAENVKDKLTEMDTIDILDRVLKATDYLALYDEEDPDDRARLENIKEMRSVAIAFPDLSNFLENVALVEQEYPSALIREGTPAGSVDEKTNAITLMTLHAAKGLEFPIVFMIGMEEGLFPHSRSLMDRNELEEERRLCYVGMTRAKNKLYLTYARK
ncbi:MAG TPA: UvrD-helicase domain-containing protein, partial [Candidatus Saccharimonadales bacterium]|nr:UvrD-helicase domain-containing protein [Candidatus Saccharimonadales bacterium]